MNRNIAAFVTIAGVLCATATAAAAADAEPTKADAFEELSSFAQVDLSLPASPAFAVLGLSPDKVERPTSLRTLAATALHSIGENGKPVNGVAIDATPILLISPGTITAGDGYAGSNPQDDLSWKNYWKRFLTRTTVSLATTSADTAGASRMAWGLRVGLIDQADPGLFFQKTVQCLQDPNTSAGPIPAKRKQGSEPANPKLETCLSDSSKKPELTGPPLWARFSLYVGYGQSWYSKSGAVTDDAPDTKTVWLVASKGLTSDSVETSPGHLRALIQGYVERKVNDRAADPNNANALLTQNSTQGIVRLKFGSANTHVFSEVGLSKVRLGNSTTENLHHVALGAEFNVGKALSLGSSGMETWIQLASVQERGFSNGKDQTGVALSLKFGAPFLDIPGGGSAGK